MFTDVRPVNSKIGKFYPPEVSAKYAEKEKRVKRGLFVDGERSWNADAVGACNSLRLYGQETGIQICMADMTTPYVVKVAV